MRLFGNARWSRLASSCTVVALLATASFFFLHHVGNQLPYDLAVQRFATELESDSPDEGIAAGYKTTYEHCEISGAVLVGSAGASSGESALRNAVVLQEFKRGPFHLCHQVAAAVRGAVLPPGVLKTRYWWGSKALFAIALRYGSVHEIREFIRIGTQAAYFLLAVSLLLLSPKTFLLAAPLLVFGALFSGIEYWADVANGFPYLWTWLFAAGLALLVRCDGRAQRRETARAAWYGTAPVYCFAGGAVSSFLWLGDGHTFLAVVWIGMVVWFGERGLAKDATSLRTKRAVSCIVLYGAGIVICYALGQVVKAAFLGTAVWSALWSGVVQTTAASNVLAASMGATSHPLIYLESFHAEAWPGLPPFVLTFVATSSLSISLGLALFEARRGRPGLLWGVLWIVGLASISSPTFFITEHMHYRTARYMFVPFALCLSCLLLAMRTMHWRMSLATTCRLAAILLGLLAVAAPVSWHLTTFKSRATAEAIESVADMQLIASAAFDVYWDRGGSASRLVWVKEECSAEDVEAPFCLHVYPDDTAVLSRLRQPHGFDNFDFFFWRYGVRGGGRCIAMRVLPDYKPVALHVGQRVPGEDHQWEVRIDLEALE